MCRHLLVALVSVAALVCPVATAQAQPPDISIVSVAAYDDFVAVQIDVDPHGCPTHQEFLYGTSVNYTTRTGALDEGSGMPHRYNGGASGLTPGTLYHFTLEITNSTGCFTRVTAGDHCFITAKDNSSGPGGEVACPAAPDGGGGGGGGGTTTTPPSSFVVPSSQVEAGLRADAPALASQLGPVFAGLISGTGGRILSEQVGGFTAPAAGIFAINVSGVVSTGGNGVVSTGGNGLRPARASAKRRRPKPVILASGKRNFSEAGPGTVTLRFTKKGRAVLKKVRARRKELRRQGRRLPKSGLTMKLSFTQAGQAPVVVEHRFRLKRKKG